MGPGQHLAAITATLVLVSVAWAGEEDPRFLPRDLGNLNLGWEETALNTGDQLLANESRIINGKLANRIDEFPYMAAVVQKLRGTDRMYFRCTAVVVDKYIAMTAAHCVYPGGDPFMICVGTIDLSGHRRCHFVTGKQVHSAYKMTYRKPKKYPLKHDLALLRSARPLVHGKVRAIKVQFQPPEFRSLVIALGYGGTSSNEDSTDLRLRWVDALNFPGQLCFDQDNVHGQSFLCAYGNYDESRGGICNGDSGGPLVDFRGSSNPANHRLVGIGSFTITFPGRPGTCDVRAGSGFAKISHTRATTWLRNRIKGLGGKFNRY